MSRLKFLSKLLFPRATWYMEQCCFHWEKIQDEGKSITSVDEVLGINPVGDFVVAVKPSQMD